MFKFMIKKGHQKQKGTGFFHRAPCNGRIQINMNIRELANLAGVSVSTVSKIMNNKDSSISASTRERVLRIAKEYNYQPYASVIEKDVRTLTLGILFRSSQSINMTLNGILDTAQRSGYTIILRESNCDPEMEFKNISILCSHRIDGILWEPVNEDSLQHAGHFSEQHIPYVIFNSSIPDATNIDYETLGYQATETLIRLGHRNIACLCTPGTRAESFSTGYKQCLFHNQIPLDQELIFQEINNAFIQKISSHSISGIVNSHYNTAISLCDAINVLRYEMPYDISLISLRDDFRRKQDYLKISTFTIPHYEYGQYLCHKLISEIEKSEDPALAFPVSVTLDNEYSIGIPYDSRSKKIVVIGSINIDNYLKVDTLPHTGKTVSSSTTSSYVGGKGINEAVGVSKLGHRVSLIGSVGNDADSEMIFRTLKAYNIDSIGTKRHSGYRTGQAYIFVQNDGDSMISIMSGANEALMDQDFHALERIFDNTAYCLIQTEIPMKAVVNACSFARERGIRTILKPAACSFLPEELLCNVNIIVPNQDEINEICPFQGNHSKQADYLLDHGVQTVIITLGADGCYVKNADFSDYFPALPFDSVDSSGACDAFISALSSYLLYGYDLKSAVKIASYAAGFSITRQGTVPALIDRNTLESYILQREPALLKRESISVLSYQSI